MLGFNRQTGVLPDKKTPHPGHASTGNEPYPTSSSALWWIVDQVWDFFQNSCA